MIRAADSTSLVSPLAFLGLRRQHRLRRLLHRCFYFTLRNRNHFELETVDARGFDEAILGAAINHLKDPVAIPDLELLLGVPSVARRRGVVGALRGTRSSKALSGLARGLEDTDAKVRYLAVVGLAEITGDSAFRPTEARFKSDEAHFLGHWRQWAQNRINAGPANR